MTLTLLAVLQIAGPSLDGRVGYSGYAFADAWTPVTVEARNRGAAIEGRLELELRGWGTTPVVYRREVILPRGAHKRYSWTLFLAGLEKEIDVRLIDREGRERARTGLVVRFFDENERRVMVVGSFPNSLASVEKSLDLGLARVDAERFPRGLQPLLAADAIVFAEPPSLDPDQEDALRRWVSAGGILIFSRGRTSMRYRRGVWRELGPAAVGETETVDVDAGGETIRVPLVRAEGDSFLSIAGRPAAFRRRIGRGEAIFLAFPLDQAGIEKVAAPTTLWRRIFRVVQSAEDEVEKFQHGESRLFHEATDTLLDLFEPGAEYVDATEMALAGLFLLGHVIIVGPFAYFWLRRRRRLSGGWKVVAASVVVYGAISLLWGGFMTPEQTRAAHLCLADPDVVQTFTVLRAGRSGIYGVRAEEALAPVTTSRTFGADLLASRVEPDGALRLPIRALATRSILSSRPAGEGEFDVACRWEGEGRKRLHVRNGSSLQLLRCVLVTPSRVYGLGNLPAGAERSIDLESRSSLKIDKWMKGLAGFTYSWYSRWTLPARADQQAMVLTVYERCRKETRRGNDRNRLRQRKLDLSPVLDRGGSVFLGRFRDDRSGIEFDVPVELQVHGLFRVVVEGVKQ